MALNWSAGHARKAPDLIHLEDRVGFIGIAEADIIERLLEVDYIAKLVPSALLPLVAAFVAPRILSSRTITALHRASNNALHRASNNSNMYLCLQIDFPDSDLSIQLTCARPLDIVVRRPLDIVVRALWTGVNVHDDTPDGSLCEYVRVRLGPLDARIRALFGSGTNKDDGRSGSPFFSHRKTGFISSSVQQTGFGTWRLIQYKKSSGATKLTKLRNFIIAKSLDDCDMDPVVDPHRERRGDVKDGLFAYDATYVFLTLVYNMLPGQCRLFMAPDAWFHDQVRWDHPCCLPTRFSPH